MKASLVSFKKKENAKINSAYSIPTSLGLIGLGTGCGYGTFKLGQEREITDAFIKNEEIIKTAEIKKQIEKFENDFFNTFENSDRYLQFMEQDDAFELWQDKKNQLEKIFTKEEIKEFKDKINNIKTTIEENTTKKTKNIKNNLFTHKLKKLRTGAAIGIGLASIFLLETKLSDKKEKPNTPFLTISTLIGAITGGIYHYANISEIRDAINKNINPPEFSFIELEKKVEGDFFKEYSKKVIDENRKFPEHLEKFEQKINSFIDGKMNRENFYGSKFEELKERIAIEKQKFMDESLKKAENLNKTLDKQMLKKIGIGTAIGIVTGILITIIKNTKNNKNS